MPLSVSPTNSGGRQSSVYDIYRDAQGFLWFAGDTDGLLRYDGYQLIRWEGDNEELDRVSYSAVLVSANDQLWAAAWGSGLFLWQHEQNRFQVFNSENSALPDDRVQTLFEDSLGRIWAGTLNGLAVAENGNVKRVEPSSPIYAERIWRMAEFDNALWVGTTSGLYRMSMSGDNWQHYIPFPERLGNNRINEIRTIRVVNDRLWLGIDGGLFEFDVDRGAFIAVDFPDGANLTPPQVNTLYPAGNNQLWVGAESGLYRVNMSTHRYISDNEGHFIHAADLDIRRIATDTNGSLWLGARDQGILQSSMRGNNFRNTAASVPAAIQPLLQRNMSAVHVAWNDDIWFGVPNGVVRYRAVDQSWFHWPYPEGSAARRAESIFTDQSGRTWIATNTSLYFIDAKPEPQATDFVEATDILRALNIEATAVTDIYQDSQKQLWFGFWGRGLAKVSQVRGTTEQITWDFTALDDLRGDLIYDFIEMDGGGLWMLTRFSGLYHKPRGGSQWISFTELSHRQGWQGTLPSDGLLCLFSNSAGELWLCSESGLFRFNIEGRTIERFTQANGLPSDRVLGITSAPGLSAENKEQLWVTTSQGLSLFEQESQQFLNFGVNDGLPAMEFVRAAVDVNSRGRVIAGTVRGAVDFLPSALEIDRTAPHVALSRLWLNDQDITGKVHFRYPELKLNSDHRSLVVRFSVLDFKSATYNTGRYRVLGLNNDWSTWSNLRELTFTQLPPGEFTIEIEGRNSLGTRAPEPLRIQVTVKGPWWEAPWVWFLGVLLVIVLSVGITRLRFLALARMNRRLDQQVKERTQELETLAKQLKEQSQTDYLTGLPNRRAFSEKFDWVVAHSARHQEPLSLVLFDVDYFKRFNDTYGHEAGDLVLTSLSKLLRRQLREQDILSRWGGEEFAILLPSTSLKGAQQVCEALRAELEHMKVEYRGENLSVTATFGVYEGNTQDKSLELWMQRADLALYQGKEKGRNQVMAYNPSFIKN
ncbi:ligand-binding sensor domain-containing diguanylate cyclase [Aliidiomarina celeris]|uniref:ligand-binding sensor domain-containing diguanylate cyclase n=1 Tax=Aliidiomarina celeris TaxID=2249428 RepID=UPI0018E5ED05|nr:ligand-binding sensor domain-containing diguanylate cyclase [Aliidiomarina celeris]